MTGQIPAEDFDLIADTLRLYRSDCTDQCGLAGGVNGIHIRIGGKQVFRCRHGVILNITAIDNTDHFDVGIGGNGVLEAFLADILDGGIERADDADFGFAIEMSLACYILLKDYEKLDSFLGEHPQAERPEECRALYKLMYPDENIDIGLSAIPSRLREGVDSTLFPWHLFLQVYLGHHELALDILEEGVNRRMGPMINFMNIPFLEPLHRYERFQRLVKNTFHADKLPDEGSVDAVDAPAGRALLEEEVVQQYLATLSHQFENEQLFLDQSLSLKTLAAQMDIHPNKLSWLLNEHIGKNFNELVNSYRLEAFKGKALDPANSHLTLLALAFDSGFNSKSVFNDFFKKKEGMTPRAWVKANTRQV